MKRILVLAVGTAALLSLAVSAQTNPSTNSATSAPGTGATGGSDTVPQTLGGQSNDTTGTGDKLQIQKDQATTAAQRAIGSSNPAHTPSGGGSGGTTGGSDTVPKK
jgi:hypothetical protein